ncbi:Cullin-3 [Sarcoptes scabiei]|uniref:Cullin-3 n=1 Tax=Sarcoptes scabiei TaxID=52283 RepID=A0A834VI52_SARSC|nr:Cullin-3 [Sarcoptes scabiei]
MNPNQIEQKQKRLITKIFETYFDNCHIDLCRRKIPFNPDGNESKSKRIDQLLSYQFVYKTINEIGDIQNIKNIDLIYRIYGQCARKTFETFATNLLQMIGFESNETIIEKLWIFLNYLNENFLPFMRTILMVQERIRSRDNRIDLSNLTYRLFYTTIIEQKRQINCFLSDYLISTLIDFNQNLFDVLRKQNRSIDLMQFSTIWNADHRSMILVKLIKLIIDLDSSSLIIYKKLFFRPFLHRLIEFYHTFANDSLRTMPKLIYLEVISQFIPIHSWLLAHLNLPRESIESIVNKFAIYCLLTKQIESIVFDDRTGFKSLLLNRSDIDMLRAYSIIQSYRILSQQKTLIECVHSCVEKFLSDRLKEFSNRFHFHRRQDALDYIQAFLQERSYWDHLIVEVFKNDQRISTLVVRFYLNLLKINERTSQAMAIYLHQIICFRMANRLPLIHQLSSMAIFANDFAQFIDYIKHYFTTRLLNGQARSLDDELNAFEELNDGIFQQIRQFHMLINDDRFHSEIKNIKLNLIDFKMIANDLKNSEEFYRNNYDDPFLRSFTVLKNGFWKFIESDRCWIPSKVRNSFKRFEESYLKLYKNRRLILNTKYTKFLVEMTFFSNENIESLCNNNKIELSMTANQFAIVNLFNYNQIVNYQTIVDRTNFQKEYNLCIALQSLIYCGLIRSENHYKTSKINKNIDFTLNDKRFVELLQTNQVDNDLVSYENIDFTTTTPLDPSMNAIDFAIIISLLSNEQDLQYRSAINLVEDTNFSFVHRKTIQSFDMLSIRIDKEQSKTNEDGQTSGERDRKNYRNSTERFSDDHSNATNNVIESNALIRTDCILFNDKLEAAIVRIFKRVKIISSLSEIQRAVIDELNQTSNRSKLFNRIYTANQITIESIQKCLNVLIAKKYIKQNVNNFFEYQID